MPKPTKFKQLQNKQDRLTTCFDDLWNQFIIYKLEIFIVIGHAKIGFFASLVRERVLPWYKGEGREMENTCRIPAELSGSVCRMEVCLFFRSLSLR